MIDFYYNSFIKQEVDSLRSKASNISGDAENSYTESMFYEDFPQFKNTETGTGYVPSHMMAVFLKMVNGTVSEARWGESWRLAASLFVAHYVTLYLRQNNGNTDGTQNAKQAADSGALIGIVTSASLGDANVSYDVSNVTQATQNWGQFNLTSYGQQYASLARIYSLGGSYVI
jgi:hypothetical protein